MSKITLNQLPSSKLLATAITAVLASYAAPGYSQILEETVVTATKRAESMQDVPISMIAMSGDAIREGGITKMEDFGANMPAITIAQNPIGNFIYIRGIGSSVNQGIEQSVSIFHDGIYMGRHQLSRAPFMDLERVEVLRGPQSILFGKNTVGGAISVITAKPTDEFEGMVSGLYGWEDGETEITGVVSGPITDSLRGRLAYRGYQIDGFMENVMTGKDGPERDDWTLRGQLVWDATDTLSITAKYETSEFEQTQQATQVGIFNPLDDGAVALNDLNQLLVGGPEKYDDERAVINDGGKRLGELVPSFAGIPGFPDLAESGNNAMDVAQVTIEWDIGEHVLTAITGYAHYDYRDICDCDFSALPLLSVDAGEDYDQWSQEIRLTSPLGETFDYIVGFYYHQADLEYGSDVVIGANLNASIAPNVARVTQMEQEQKQWAVFGSLTWNITDLTRATFGLRYSEETKDVDHELQKRFSGGWDFGGDFSYGDTAEEYDRFEQEMGPSGLPGLLDVVLWEDGLGTFEHQIVDREREEEFVTWSVNLEHDLGEDTMIYGLVATGVKGGGFDALFLKPADDPTFEFEEEKIISYELGIKSTLLDGGMTLNATLFRSEIEDLQTSIFDGKTGFFVTNAAEITTQGVEVDMKWAATEALIVSLAGTYLDNEYTDFPNSQCWAIEVAADPEGCLEGKDVSGSPNQFAPEWSYNLNLDYAIPVGSAMEARAVLNVNYSDDFFTGPDLDPILAFQEAYTKVDLRISLGQMDGTWEVALIGKNLTDEMTSNSADDQPLVLGNGFKHLDRMRSYAVQASYRF